MAILLPDFVGRRRKRKPVAFVAHQFKGQYAITMTKDLSGWVDRDRRLKFQFAQGRTYNVDEAHAVEFIVKGYATGELPRAVSEDERAEILSGVTTVALSG